MQELSPLSSLQEEVVDKQESLDEYQVCVAFPIMYGGNKAFFCVTEKEGFNEYGFKKVDVQGLKPSDISTYHETPVDYQFDELTAINIYNSRNNLEGKDATNGSRSAGSILVKKLGGNGIDFKVQIHSTENDVPIEINCYTLLRLIQLGAYYESSFEEGKKATDQEIIFPIPNNDGGLNILVFHPHIRKKLIEGEDVIDEKGEDNFQTQIKDVLIAFIEADEQTDDTNDKIGLMEIFQDYKPIDEPAISFRLRQRGRNFNEIRRFKKIDLQNLAKYFADTLIDSPRIRRQLELQLEMQNFHTIIDSRVLYPKELMQKAAEVKIGKLETQQQGYEQTIAKLSKDNEHLRNTLQDLANKQTELEEQIATKERDIAEIRQMNQELPEIQAELDQLKRQRIYLQEQIKIIRDQILRDKSTYSSESDNLRFKRSYRPPHQSANLYTELRSAEQTEPDLGPTLSYTEIVEKLKYLTSGNEIFKEIEAIISNVSQWQIIDKKQNRSNADLLIAEIRSAFFRIPLSGPKDTFNPRLEIAKYLVSKYGKDTIIEIFNFDIIDNIVNNR